MSNAEDAANRQSGDRANVQIAQDVNRYLNRYVNIADAKAGALLATDLAVGSSALRFSSDCWLADLVNGTSLVALVLSLTVAGTVLFPRLPKGKKGLIFWEDIREHDTLASYADKFRESKDEELVAQYLSQNWYVSKVLHSKHRLVRWATGLFVAGVLLHTAAFLP